MPLADNVYQHVLFLNNTILHNVMIEYLVTVIIPACTYSNMIKLPGLKLSIC